MGLSSAAISMLLAPSASILSPILIESRTLRLESRTLRVMTQSRKGKPKLIRIYPYIVFGLYCIRTVGAQGRGASRSLALIFQFNQQRSYKVSLASEIDAAFEETSLL